MPRAQPLAAACSRRSSQLKLLRVAVPIVVLTGSLRRTYRWGSACTWIVDLDLSHNSFTGTIPLFTCDVARDGCDGCRVWPMRTMVKFVRIKLPLLLLSVWVWLVALVCTAYLCVVCG